jgi:hypothetical protein
VAVRLWKWRNSLLFVLRLVNGTGESRVLGKRLFMRGNQAYRVEKLADRGAFIML